MIQRNADDAEGSKEWKKAMDEEIKELHRNET